MGDAAGGVNVQRSYDNFDVTLASMPDLNAVIRERHARGVDWFGLTRYELRWAVPVDSRGGCRLQAAGVELSVKVTLPRLAPGIRLSGHDDIRWRELAEHVERHEAEHVRIATDGAYDVLDAIRGADCKTWRARAQEAFRQMDLRQRDFDRGDRSANRSQVARAVEPDMRPREVRTAEEELNGSPVEWTVGN